MPDLAQLASYIGAILIASGGLLAYFKRKPGEKQDEIIHVGKAEIDIASGVVVLAKDAAQMQRQIAEQLEMQLAGMRAEIDVMRNQLRDAEAEVTLLREDLRTVKGKLITATQRITALEDENRLLRQENARLRGPGSSGLIRP